MFWIFGIFAFFGLLAGGYGDAACMGRQRCLGTYLPGLVVSVAHNELPLTPDVRHRPGQEAATASSSTACSLALCSSSLALSAAARVTFHVVRNSLKKKFYSIAFDIISYHTI